MLPLPCDASHTNIMESSKDTSVYIIDSHAGKNARIREGVYYLANTKAQIKDNR